jgi:cyclopropane fatty-acyl-phospholipid synthase-like methyltransferase
MTIMDSEPMNKEGYTLNDWQGHYDRGDLMWDIEQVSPPFARLWEEKKLAPGKAIIPGCGRGHEVVYFAERGFDVTAVDFAQGAVTLLERSLAEKKLHSRVIRADFFALDASHDGFYDIMFEQTFFSAIAPSQRHLYVETVRRILKKGGLLAALFYETGEAGGPPFNTTPADIRNYFGLHFAIERLEKADNSIERRKGKEWLAFLRKI